MMSLGATKLVAPRCDYGRPQAKRMRLRPEGVRVAFSPEPVTRPRVLREWGKV